MGSRYNQEVAKFGKSDGILALCVFLGYVLFSVAFVAIRGMFSVSWYLNTLVTVIVTSFQAGIIFLIILRKKQGLSSIGLQKKELFHAVRLGFLCCLIPILFVVVIPGVYGGLSEIQIGGLLVALVTTFFFAAHEDIIFVGFIQTRLYGLFKSDRISIPVGALLFALMHIPPWLIMGRLDTSNLLMGIGAPFIGWVLMHFVFVSIFKKYYSLIPVIILHTINNYSWNFTQTTTAFGIDLSLILLIFYALLACVMFFIVNKRSEKNITDPQ